MSRLTCAYARVSSPSQDLGAQIAALEKGAALRGYSIDRLYSEKASAKTMAREALSKLRADIRSGIVAQVLVAKLDRVCRTGAAEVFAFAEECRKSNTELIALSDNVHLKCGTEDLATTCLLFALGLTARLERSAINDRIAMARARVEAEGRKWGRPSRLSPQIRQRVRAMRAQGRTLREIAMAAKM